jgi:hypothetical protein
VGWLFANILRRGATSLPLRQTGPTTSAHGRINCRTTPR